MKVTRAVGSYFVERLELDAGVGGKEGDRCVAEDVNLHILKMLGQDFVQMFGECREIALNGSPAVDWFFLLLGDIDQWIMLAVPDGCELLWVEMKKSLAIAFDQNRDRALRFYFVGLCRHHLTFPCGHKCSHNHICFRDFSPALLSSLICLASLLVGGFAS